MKMRVWIAVLVGFMLVAGIAACGGTNGIEATVEALASVSGDSAEAEEQVSTHLGEWMEGSGLAMVAWAVEDPANPKSSSYEPKPGTRLVAVEWELGSLSDTHHSAPHAAQLIDDRGVRHDAVFGSMADHRDIENRPIRMGERIRGWLAFELPEGRTPLALEYRPSVWGRDIELKVSLVE
jgi:hypothetical protein